jgi:very-short-patch-repair endonuclease
MLNSRSIGELSKLSAGSFGVFRGSEAVRAGVSRNQLTALIAAGVLERALPDVYRMTVVPSSDEQRLRAALLWAGETAVVAGLSAGALYRLEGVRSPRPEIVVPNSNHVRSKSVVVHRTDDQRPLMVRRFRGLQVTGVEATLVSLAHLLDGEAFEVACEDARRRRLTGVPALRAYLERFRRSRLHGFRATRDLLDDLDPVFPSRSTLEVKTRRLLVAHGITGFQREFPLEWDGHTHHFDFVFEPRRTILETNGKRWHDDASDYEHDNEKWSVPGRHGYRLVFATWEKVTRQPAQLLAELTATLAA